MQEQWRSPVLVYFTVFIHCIFWLETRHCRTVGGQKKSSLAKNLQRASFNLTAWACCHYYSPTFCSPFLRGVRRHCAYRLPYRSPFEKSATFHPGVFLVDSTARAKGPLLSSLFPTWDSWQPWQICWQRGLESFKRSLSRLSQCHGTIIYFRCWCHFDEHLYIHSCIID